MKKIILSFLLFFITIVQVQSQIFEDFEGTSIPVSGNWALTSGEWKVFDNGIGLLKSWKANTVVAQTYGATGRSADVEKEFLSTPNTTSEDWLVMPRKVMRVNEQLRFYTRQGLVGDTGTLYQIRVSTNTDPLLQSGYTILKTYTEDELVGPSPATYSDYTEKIIDLTVAPQNYAGQNVFIAFVKVNTQEGPNTEGDRWLVDNVQLAQKCLVPGPLDAVSITTTTARLKWGYLATGVQFEYQFSKYPLTENIPGSFDTYNSPNGASITQQNLRTGLEINTQYEYRVRAICGPGITSDWSGKFRFFTFKFGSQCIEPISFNTLPYSSSGNTLDFGNNINQPSGSTTTCGITGKYLEGADVIYKYTAPLTGGPSQISISMNPLGATNTGMFIYSSCANIGTTCLASVANNNSTIRNITPFNVTPGGTYYIVLSSLVTTFSYEYVLTIQGITCPAPTALSAIATQNSVNLSWTSPAATSSWQYAVQTFGSAIPSGAGIPTTVSTNPNVTTLLDGTTPLVPGTDYQFWVRSECGSTGTFSPWAGPYFFKTSLCSDGPGVKCSYEFVMSDSASNGWEGAKMEVRQSGFIVATFGEQITGATATFPVMLCDDLPLELFWADGGIHPDEVGISIRNPFGQTIFTMGPNNQQKVGTILYGNPQVMIKFAECDYPDCQPPTGLAAITTPLPSSVTTNSAKIKWTIPSWATNNNYDVYVTSIAPFTPPVNGVIPAQLPPSSFYFPNVTLTGTPLSFQLTGLLQDTDHKFWVRTNCSNNGPSDWSTTPGTFKTLPQCPKVTALVANTITASSAKLSWTTPAAPVVTSWYVLANPVTLPQTPKLTLVKSASVGGTASAGDVVTYSFVVTNTGSFAVNDLKITDLSISPTPFIVFPPNLLPGGYGTATATYTITAADVTAGSITNSATVNGITATTSIPVSDVSDSNDTALLGDNDPTVTPLIPSAPQTFALGAPWIAVAPGFGTTANPFILTNLIQDSDYNYYVVSNCNATNNGLSNVAGPKLFTTLPTCPKPPTFALVANSLTTTSAKFTWTFGKPTDTQWEILLIPSNTQTLPTTFPSIDPSANPVPGQVFVTVNAAVNLPLPYEITGLQPAKIYYYYIRTVCSPTDKSRWTIVKVFNTLPCNAADKCNYKLKLVNISGTPPGPVNDWLGARLQIRQNGIVVQTVGTAQINGALIDVPICPNVPFDIYWSVAGTTPNDISFTLYNPFSEVLYQKNANVATDLPETVLYNSIGSCTPIGCVVPTTQAAVPAATITAFTAVLDWTPVGTETQWEIVVMPVLSAVPPLNSATVLGTPTGNNVGGTIYYLAGSHPFTVTGLVPDTDYQYYIRSVCAGSTSVWSIVPVPFKTKISCYQPATITLVPNSQTSSSVSLWWTNNPLNTATSWDIIAVPTTTIPTAASVPSGTYSGSLPNVSSPYILTGLLPNITYDIYVRTNCVGLNVGTDIYGTSKWTGPSPAVTTDPTCYPPVNLTWINDNLNPAELTWSPNPNQVGNSQWTVYTQLYTGAVNVPTSGGLAVTTVVTPTPIQYNVRDSFGTVSNNATIGVGLVDILPIATNDSANYSSPVVINVLANDTTGDTILPNSVSLIIPSGVTVSGLVVNATNGNVTTMTIPNQGTWTVNAGTGAITFTKLAAFTGVPTPVQYNGEDQEGNQTNNATITFATPVAVANNDTVFYTSGTIVIPVLINDTIGGTPVPTTVSLVPPTTGVTGVVTDANLDVTAMTITGEGTWTVNITTGVITFTPVIGFTGFPTPILYNVEDILSVQSNNGTVTLSNVDVLPIAINDTQPLVAGVNTILVLANDNTGDTVLPTRVSLIVPIGATGTAFDALLDVISFNIPLQGKWAVNITTGVITFTPLPLFTGVPTPIQYTVRDAQGNISNPATVTLTSLLPIATNDSLPFTNNSIASVNVTTNDTTGGIVLPPTVSLIPPTGAIEIVTNTAVTPNIITSFRVPNEGRWSLVNGVVTFTPILSYTTPTGTGALAPGFYEFYIASNCGPNGESVLAGPKYFSIYADPVICAAINLNLGTNTNTVNVCEDDTCTDLTANYNDIFDTSSYSMVPVKYTNIPYPYNGGPNATVLPIDADDLWSDFIPSTTAVDGVPFPPGFKFCFFGTNSEKVWVGSNGVVTFTQPATNRCEWSFNQTIPNVGFPIRNAIYAPYQDIDPRTVNSPIPADASPLNRTINYGVVGTAPCRAFVINYFNIGQYSCNQSVGLQTSQVVLYETSNIVEIYVKDRTPCVVHNGGRAVIGIQNATGDLAFVPPGKNTGTWTIKEEAYRFTPAGASVVEFAWKDTNNAIISTGPTINVCPTVSTIYNATATYTSCGENPVTVTKPVTVNVNSVQVVDMEDVSACGTYTLPALPVGNYYTATNGGGTMLVAGDVITSNTTLYIYATTAAGITPVCTDEDSFAITIINPSTPVSTGNISTCALKPIQTITADAFVADGETVKWFDAPTNGNEVNPTWNQLGSTTYYAESAFISKDYTDLPDPTTITIPAGQTSVTVSVATLSDTKTEPTETFFVKGQVTSANTVNQYISGKANLTDDASGITVSISDPVVVEGSDAKFIISLSNPSTQPTVINLTTANGSAVSILDYNSVTTTITIAPGDLTATVLVPTITNTIAELEKFTLTGTVTSTNTLNTSIIGTATITEVASQPSVSISDIYTVEGSPAVFTISLSKPSLVNTVISLKSVAGTALNIDCRGAVRTPVTLTLFEIPVPISGGPKSECSTYPTVQTLTATATPPTSDLGVTWYDAPSGGNLVTNPILNSVGTKTYYAESYVINTDYTATQGTITIPAGQSSAAVSVPILSDNVSEPNETFYLNASVTSTNTLNTNIVGTGLISGVSSLPTIYISNPTIVEGANASFTITLSKASLTPILINFTTTPQTATVVDDYLQTFQQIVIPAGSVSTIVSVTTNTDLIAETQETFALVGTVTSSNTSNSSTQGIATITETTALPSVTISNTVATEGSNAQFIISLSTPSTLPTVITYTTNPNTAGPGCVSPTRTSVSLEIYGLPSAPVSGGDQDKCVLSPVQTLTATATPPAGSSVLWYNSAVNGTPITNQTLNSLGSTSYFAESVNNVTGCKSGTRTEVKLSISDLPMFDFIGGCEGTQYKIEVVPVANFDLASATYQWKDPNGNLIGGNSPTVFATIAGNYSCLVTNTLGCNSSKIYPATAINCSIQKGISPKGVNGGDGNNDFLDLEGLDVTKIEIFNRYGMAVYTKNDYVKEWYGQSDDGNELSDGTYYYVIKRKNLDPVTGWIYINREQ
jgi:gliding motility-associated-like protein